MPAHPPNDPGAVNPVVVAVTRIGRRTVVEIESDPRWPGYCSRDGAARSMMQRAHAVFDARESLEASDLAETGALVDELIRILTLMRRGS